MAAPDLSLTYAEARRLLSEGAGPPPDPDRLRAAETLLTELLRAHPGEELARYQRGLCRFDLKEYDGAYADLRSVWEVPDYAGWATWFAAQAAQQIAWQAIGAGTSAADWLARTDEALTRFGALDSSVRAAVLGENATAAENAAALLLLSQGAAALNRQAYDEAYDYFEQAQRQGPELAAVPRFWGIALAQEGRVKEAIAQYRRALELQPDFPDVYNRWGVALMSQEAWKKALRPLRQAADQYAAQEPDSPERYFPLRNLAVCHQHLREPAAALRYWAQALPLRPEGFGDAALVGKALAEADQPLDTETTQTLLGYLDAPQQAELFNAWGNVQYEAGRYEPALGAYDRALARYPEAAYAWRNRALCLRQLERYPEAEAALERALEAATEETLIKSVLEDLIYTCQRLEKWARALAYADRLAALPGGSSDWLTDRRLESHYHLGYGAYAAGTPTGDEQARAHFGRITQAPPADRWYYYWSFYYEGYLPLRHLAADAPPAEVRAATEQTLEVLGRLTRLDGPVAEFDRHLHRANLYAALCLRAWQEVSVRYRFEWEAAWQEWKAGALTAYETAARQLMPDGEAKPPLDWLLTGQEVPDEPFTAAWASRGGAPAPHVQSWGGFAHECGSGATAEALYKRAIQYRPADYVPAANLFFLYYDTEQLAAATRQFAAIRQAAYGQQEAFRNQTVFLDA